VLCTWSEPFDSAGRFLEAFAQARFRTPSPRRRPGSSIKGLDSGFRRNDGSSYGIGGRRLNSTTLPPMGANSKARCSARGSLPRRIDEIRQAEIYGMRPEHTGRQAATKYSSEAIKASIDRDAQLLSLLDPFLGTF